MTWLNRQPEDHQDWPIVSSRTARLGVSNGGGQNFPFFPVNLAHTISWNYALRCKHMVPYSKSKAASSTTVQLCLSFYEKFYLERVERDFLLISQLFLVALLGQQGSPALEMWILNQGSQDYTFTLWLQRDNSEFLALHQPSAHPALMPTSTSQIFLNRKYLFSSSISK